MATTATQSQSSWKAPAHSHSNSRSNRPLTTPRSNQPLPAAMSPNSATLSPGGIPNRMGKENPSTSPSYFGLVVAGDESLPTDSGPGTHTKQNWNSTVKSPNKTSRSDRNNNAEYELFRRQSERSVAFSLNSLPSSRDGARATNSKDGLSQSPISPTTSANNAFGGSLPQQQSSINKPTTDTNPFFTAAQAQDSPMSMTPRASVSDGRDARLSLPAHELQESLQALKAQRSHTLPAQPDKETALMLGPQDVAKILNQCADSAIILDLRISPQYAKSRIRGALNLCIPTTLLKRPAYTVQKLAETFTSDKDKATFSKWRNARFIIVYDATSSLAKDAITSFHVLKKFTTEGWNGTGVVIKGGFAHFSTTTPQLIDHGTKTPTHTGKPSLSTNIAASPPKLPVAGGCVMPATENAANPFFNNIRQNMDLVDGVGQIPIKRPKDLQQAQERRLPAWLKRAASVANEGKDVSDKFLGIERTEQSTMQKALSGSVSFGTPGPRKAAEIQVAGIEKGSKNRYNNIFPFEHSRVKLQNVPSYACDYVNASFVKARYSNRKYIATQAPIPQTFGDFWRMIWEQEVAVVVMLTAESEGGQVKSHAYWKSGDYDQIRIKLVQEAKISLASGHVQKRPGTGRRLTTSSATPSVEKKFNFEPTRIEASQSKPEDTPHVIVRRFAVGHSAYPSKPAREVTQVHYTQWPDFGAPASPTAILNIIDLVDKIQRAAASSASRNEADEPAKPGQKPIIVHCSAGCGRTGTFCTIDSVIDMLKRQRKEKEADADAMEVEHPDNWVHRDDIDLVAKAVQDFRHQRLSMVQNLRQFVLCYESVLQWLHDHQT